ncbi:hypothetical protein LSCM1_07860 [Leishmania martiniquensis]|uniref:Uncharacterized protein n=1 Tax=Leishmania martiniquensis TaxID=1580590 RepID=A0A836KR63_9TRYP|nr:hypothetical protein LSCM1_07860 [Leishmania martiniquensis]
MGRTIIKLGVRPGIGEKEKSPTRSADQPVSADVALSSVTGEGGCVVDSTMLQKYLMRKYLSGSRADENALAELAGEMAIESPTLNSKSIIYEDWGL